MVVTKRPAAKPLAVLCNNAPTTDVVVVISMSEVPDETIVAAIQSGDHEQFGELINRYEAKMRRYAQKFLACQDDIDDVVQEVFIKAYTNLQSFDVDRRFSPWLYRIAHNSYVNQLKKQQRSLLSLVDSDTLLPQLMAQETADELALSVEQKAAMETVLDTLSPKYRAPVALFFYEELSYQEISEVLKIPVTTVGVRISRAKALLKKQLATTTL